MSGTAAERERKGATEKQHLFSFITVFSFQKLKTSEGKRLKIRLQKALRT